MTCVFIHYRTSIVFANSFFWLECPFKLFSQLTSTGVQSILLESNGSLPPGMTWSYAG